MVVEKIVLAKYGIQGLEHDLESLHISEAHFKCERVVHQVHRAPALVVEALHHFGVRLVHLEKSMAVVAKANLHHKSFVILVVWEEDAKYEYICQHGDHRIRLVHFAQHEIKHIVDAVDCFCVNASDALVDKVLVFLICKWPRVQSV